MGVSPAAGGIDDGHIKPEETSRGGIDAEDSPPDDGIYDRQGPNGAIPLKVREVNESGKYGGASNEVIAAAETA